MPAYHALEASLHETPLGAVAAVRGCVERSGGVIVEATRFSNKALSFKIEAFPAQVARLETELGRLGALHGSQPVPTGAPALASLAPNCEVLALLHVTLVHDLPDERVELPRVPG
jgi:hypothetical protein